jgi:DNA-binding transcriptional MerR regulator
MSNDREFTLSELSALADTPARTIRYYVAQGLLPAPGRDGPTTRYGEGFLARLRLIRQLRESYLPLSGIRARLAGITDAEAIALVETPAVEPPDSALDYVRALLGGVHPGLRLERGQSESRLAEPLLADPALPEAAHAKLAHAELANAEPPGFSIGSIAEVGRARPARAVDVRARATVRASATDRPTAPIPERSQWERIVLEPDVELHVRRPLSRVQNRRVVRLLAFARELNEGVQR